MAYDTMAPGVYVKEITQAGPIAGVSSTVTAFLGTPATLPPASESGVPFPVTTWTAYVAKYGAYKAGLSLPYAVKGFFDNGGGFAYIVPIADPTGLDPALGRLTRYPDVSMVCLPGTVTAASQAKVLGHCDAMGDRFAILDGVQDPNPVNPQSPLLTQRAGLDSASGLGALYWPWLVIADPAAPDARVTVPPSGHVAGIMARCDDTVGVHRAPANEAVRGALDLDYQLNDTEHGQLNHAGVNAIRRFPGGPPLVWGARTLTTNTSWQYVNVRRLVCYLEDSIRQGVRWAVFQPNNLALWRGLERTITEFLTRIWQAGALFGATAKEAFYVSITEELNPPDVRARGEVVIEIGLAPSRPAEFVELRIGLWDGGASISER